MAAMKTFLLLFLLSVIILRAHAQSVAINADASQPNASAMLDVKSTSKGMLIPRMTMVQRNLIPLPTTGLMIYQNDNTPGYYFFNGSSWAPLAGTGAINYWTPNGFNIYNNNGGNVGIGTSAPQFKLTVQTQSNQFGLVHTDGDVTMASYIGTFQGVLGGWLGTRTAHPLYFFTNNSAQQMALLPNGNFGIGTISPTNKLQINGETPGFVDYDFAIGRNAHTMAIYQGPNFTNLQSTANISLNPKNGTGYVGINTGSNPNNKLQIGSLGSVNFSGNDLAIGNGTNALAIYQSNTSALISSTTDILLRPRNNGQGRVGINTNTPRAPLEVGFSTTFTQNFNSEYSYLNLFNTDYQLFLPANYPFPNVSIMAEGRIYASEFNAFSDARIKNILGISNSATDLQSIDAIEVTDYKMKDKVKYGDKSYKKVIAQQVEKVCPQVVSRNTDFIPNVYQLTNRIEKVEKGFLLSFRNDHNISRQAKKLSILSSETGDMKTYDIVSIPSTKQVSIHAPDLNTDKAFVYGEEVDDFRTVDYEGLTTLNISATQELSKLVKQQQQIMAEQQKQIDVLIEAIKLLKEKGCPVTL